MRANRIVGAGRFFAILLGVFFGLRPAVPAIAGDSAAGVRGEAVVVSEVLVDVGDASEQGRKLQDLARSLIFIRENDRFSESRLNDSLEALKLVEMFCDIDFRIEAENDRCRLLFRLTPCRRIRDIRIHGKYPLFEQDILDVMNIHAGGALLPADLETEKRMIESLYREKGFIDPEVRVTARDDPSKREVEIDIQIDKGEYFRVERIVFEGNRAFSAGSLLWRMKTPSGRAWPWSSARFVEKRLKTDIQNLIDFYRGRHFPEIRIEYAMEKDTAAGRVRVFITVDEGPRYQVVFEKNKGLSRRTLKKELTIFKDGNRNDLGIKRSVRKIRERYRKAGYLQARINVEEQRLAEDGRDLRILRLIVDEGPRSTVGAIHIEGNNTLDEGEIKRQVLTRAPGWLASGAFVPETLAEDLDAIRTLYLKEGFMETRVNAVEKYSDGHRTVALDIRIDEGPRTLVESVRITGLKAVPEDRAAELIRLKAGQPFRTYMVQNDENALSVMISENGYPHVKVKGDVAINADHTAARVTYRVDEGPCVTMGKAYFNGNLRTRERILSREVLLKPGEPFSLKRLQESQRNLRNLNCVQSVRFKTVGLKEKADSVGLVTEVEEKKPYYVEAGTGYENERGLFLHARAGDRNLLGANKEGWVMGEVSQVGYRAEFGLAEPRFLGTRTSAGLGIYAEERDEFNQEFGTRSMGATLALGRKLRKTLTAGLSLGVEKRQQYLTGVLSPLKRDELDPRTIMVLTPSVRYDTRDSFVQPRKGVLSIGSVDFSKGIENRLDDFLKYNLDLRYFTSPLEHLTLACIGRVGFIDPYNAMDAVPQDQLFFLGGATSVRGYAENMLDYDAAGNPVGGRLALSGTLEGRIALGDQLEIPVFFDAGRLDKEAASIVSDGLRMSFGTGIRYLTPIGPVGLLYGHKIDRREGEGAGRLHFSIGYTF